MSGPHEYFGVQLSATNEETEPYRITRLHGVLTYMVAKTEPYHQDLLNKIKSLDDHKGELTVVWKYLPRPEEQQLVSATWENGTIGDGGGPIEHLLFQPSGVHSKLN